jgi:peptidoglycan hydrolase-like protein with peptidoglycan-binding domain
MNENLGQEDYVVVNLWDEEESIPNVVEGTAVGTHLASEEDFESDPNQLELEFPEVPDEVVERDPFSHEDLTMGDTGDAVKEVQRFLNGRVTGVFDKGTSNRVKNFQVKHGLQPTGRWGSREEYFKSNS